MDRLDALSRDARAERAAAELGRAGGGAEPTLRDAAAKFESYLLGQIFAQASKPLSDQPLLDASSASRMYRELYIQEVASQVGAGAGLGLARLLESGLRASPDQPVDPHRASDAASATPQRGVPTRDPA